MQLLQQLDASSPSAPPTLRSGHSQPSISQLSRGSLRTQSFSSRELQSADGDDSLRQASSRRSRLRSQLLDAVDGETGLDMSVAPSQSGVTAASEFSSPHALSVVSSASIRSRRTPSRPPSLAPVAATPFQPHFCGACPAPVGSPSSAGTPRLPSASFIVDFAAAYAREAERLLGLRRPLTFTACLELEVGVALI
jgi:hypothetical protein